MDQIKDQLSLWSLIE